MKRSNRWGVSEHQEASESACVDANGQHSKTYKKQFHGSYSDVSGGEIPPFMEPYGRGRETLADTLSLF